MRLPETNSQNLSAGTNERNLSLGLSTAPMDAEQHSLGGISGMSVGNADLCIGAKVASSSA